MGHAINAIDEDVRRSFESAWRRGSPADVGEYLPDGNDPSFLATLEELVCIDLEFRWNQIAASAGSGEASTIGPRPCIEMYLDRFPQLKSPVILQRLVDQEFWARRGTPFPASAEEFQQRFPQLGIPGTTFRRRLSEAHIETIALKQAAVASAATNLPPTVAGYELLEVLGRGGMGMVYKVRQAKADRLLAMKVANCSQLPADLRQDLRRRFESEVRAAARLSHDHLMPIYDVGETGESLFYTMPIVDGDLAAETRTGPLTNERAARYVAQAAQGVAVAHAAGLLHRDIKPQNLMLDRRPDRVLVADFGLARLAADDEHLTRTGDVVGTPPYMPPEQIRDPRGMDARADVYALGATLYHLLVGRPPFQAATASETLRQVLEEDPVSPRLINSQVDRDLETICLRCLQKEPQLRFGSASELADDLQRYLRGEPIVSRPLGMSGRVVRWSRRNPLVASLAASLVAAMVLISVVAGVAVAGWNRAEQEKHRMLANSREGQAVLNGLFTYVRNEPLLNQPGQEEIHQYLIGSGLKHYQSLANLAVENETLATDLLAAQKELGLLSLELDGKLDDAADQLRQVIAAASRLPSAQQESLPVRETLGDCWNGLGQVHHRLHQERESIAAFQKAIEFRKQVVRQARDKGEPGRKLANATMNRGLAEAALGEIETSRRSQEEAQLRREQLVAGDAKNPRLLRDVAQGEFNLARLDLTDSRAEAGLIRLRQATQRFEQLTRDYPTDARMWLRYIECVLTLSRLGEGASVSSGSETEETLPQSLRLAAEDLRAFATVAPANRTYRIALVELYQQANEQLLSSGGADEAEVHWQNIERLINQFDAQDTQSDLVRARLISLRQRGLVSLGQGQQEKANDELHAAITAWRLAKERPEGVPFRTAEWESDWSALEQLANSLSAENCGASR